MRSAPILPLVIVLGLAAQGAAAHAGGLRVCNGKHKRPANLYGSVLSVGLKPAVAETRPTAGAGPKVGAPPAAMVATPDAKPAQVSRAHLKASFASCEGDRA